MQMVGLSVGHERVPIESEIIATETGFENRLKGKLPGIMVTYGTGGSTKTTFPSGDETSETSVVSP